MEKVVKEGKKGKTVIKKLFWKHGDERFARKFNARTWQNMTDPEREMWVPQDDTVLEDPGRFDRYESMKAMDQGMLEKLRIQPGTEIDLMGITATVLKWGAKQHLVSLDYSKKDPDKPNKYGIVARTTKDTSYGTMDTLNTFQQYHTFDTEAEAEAAYKKHNE